MKISMVIPCYNSEKTIRYVHEKIENIYENMGCEYEFVLVNDCSKDRTWDEIKEICCEKDNIIGINLTKNVGQHAAVMAGFREASGNIIMSCDDDGQTPIENIPILINKLIEDNYDVVCAKFTGFEKKSMGRRLGTKMNNAMANWLIERPKGIETRLFLAAKQYIIREICAYEQPYPYIGGLLLRTTQNIGNVEMSQHAREIGVSGYSFKKMVQLWMNGFTAFSIKPLRLASIIGAGSALLGFAGGVVIILHKLVKPDVYIGWSSIMVIILFMSGLILLVLGITGEYIGRMYMCINNTPQYVVKECVRSQDIQN